MFPSEYCLHSRTGYRTARPERPTVGHHAKFHIMRTPCGILRTMSEATYRPAVPDFRTESAMRAPVERWLESQGFLTKAEFPLPWGICDVVGIQLSETHAKKRVSSRQTQPVSSLELIQLLDSIPSEKAITLTRLHSMLRTSQSTSEINSALQRLEKQRLVSFPRRNHIQKHVGWTPLYERIVAVEMKLCKVRVALAQARAHLMFADESYVALPSDVAGRLSDSDRRQEFMDLGIGLISVAKEGAGVVLVRDNPTPSPTDLSRLFKAHCAERFWRMWFTGNAASIT